jgi:signal transduction histidine kinase
MDRIRLRVFWIVTLVTLGLVLLCTVIAVSLFREQDRITRVLKENVGSRKAAVELEECLAGLIAQEKDRVESVSALQNRALTHLQALSVYADHPEEQQLYQQTAGAFAEYMHRWGTLPPPGSPDRDKAVTDAARFLESRVLRPCQDFRIFNGEQLDISTQQHERILSQLGWGMALVGGLGGVAGMVLGFGVARGLSRSIRRLQVQISDAAGKLGQRLPQIVVTPDGDLRGLHRQVDQLTSRIETVVQQLHQREREVLRAEQLAAVGQLAAGVAHEIRNPLTSIKMLVQLALEEGAAVPPDDLGVIEGEVRKMEHSLQTFLDFARPARAERRPIDLLDVVHTVVGLTRGRAEKQGVSVRLVSPSEPIVLTADSGQLQQVLVNLVLNALDMMPGGGVMYLVVRTGPGRVEVEVSDSGPGISPEMMDRLFSPFASGKDTGLGLGLVISQRIAEDHGGTITAANRPGGGATFTVRLPIGSETGS